tara:strand:- start:2817 stop:3386 length:570 start_codon:yes stop_codon:yes gene_type:complete
MAEGTSMRAQRLAAKERYGTRNLKKAARVQALAEADKAAKLLEQAQDPEHQAREESLRRGLMTPETGPQQTIDVRSALAGNQGATQDAARAAGGGAQDAASRAAAAVQAKAASDISQKYGLAAQEAAQRRIEGGLMKGGEDQWGTALAKQATAGAIQGGIGAGTTLGTGGIAKGMGLDPSKAMQYGTVS